MSLVVLGGMGSIIGAVVGAVTLSIIASIVASYVAPSWSTMVFFSALFFILLIRPHGLFGKHIN